MKRLISIAAAVLCASMLSIQAFASDVSDDRSVYLNADENPSTMGGDENPPTMGGDENPPTMGGDENPPTMGGDGERPVQGIVDNPDTGALSSETEKRAGVLAVETLALLALGTGIAVVKKAEKKD